MTMEEIREIFVETDTDPYVDGRRTRRCRVDVRDADGGRLGRIELAIENTPVPIVGIPDEANREPACALGALMRAADRIVVDDLRPTALEVASDFTEIPWERVVSVGASVEAEYMAVAAGGYLLLTRPEWEMDGVDLVPTGEFVEIEDRIATKVAYGLPSNFRSGDAVCRLPLQMGASLADDVRLLEESRAHRCVRLGRHLAGPGATEGRASFEGLDMRAVSEFVEGYLRGWADVETAAGRLAPTILLDPARDDAVMDRIARRIADRIESREMGPRPRPLPWDMAPFDGWTEETAAGLVSNWRRDVVECAAGRLRAEISRDPARFRAMGGAPSHEELVEGLEEAFGMYAIAPSHREILECEKGLACRFVLGGSADDREIARSIAMWSLCGSGPWDPARAGVDGAYRTCTAQWICETQGTDLASVVNGIDDGPFARSMRPAVLDQAAWSRLPEHAGWQIPTCALSIRAEASLAQMASAEALDPAMGRPATVGTIPAATDSPAALMLSTPRRSGGDDDCDIHSIPLERPIELPSDRVSATYLIDRPDRGRAIAAMRTTDGRGIEPPIRNRQASASKIKF